MDLYITTTFTILLHSCDLSGVQIDQTRDLLCVETSIRNQLIIIPF